MQQADIVIIGGGIAGAAAGFALAPDRRVILLERETQPGYHSTGRSAALFTEAYGNSAIRALTIASRAFFMAPPPGFAEHQLLTPRGVVMVGRADQKERFERALAEARRHVKSVRAPDPRRGSSRACRSCAATTSTDAFVEPEAMDIDVHARAPRLSARPDRAGRAHRHGCRGHRPRRATAPAGASRRARATFAAPVVVNAAGAWCDEVAKLAGARADRAGAEAAHGDHLRSAARAGVARLAVDDRRRRAVLLQARRRHASWPRPPTRRRCRPATCSPTSSTSPSWSTGWSRRRPCR